MKRKLFLKIFFSYLVLVSLSFFVLDLLVKDQIRKFMTVRIEQELMTSARLINLNSPQAILGQFRNIAKLADIRVTLVDARGKVFADSERDALGMENHLNRPEIQEARLKGSGRAVRFSQTLGVDMLYVAVPVKAGAEITGYIRLARPLREIQNLLDTIYQSIFFALIIVAVVSLLIALFLSYRLAEPIRVMEQFTEKLRGGKPPSTILLRTSDETKKLADNINYLVEEWQSKIRLAQEERSKLMTALTSINEGVLILNNDERIEFISPALADTLSGEYGDVTGKTLMEAFRNVELQKVFQSFKQTHHQASGEITLGVTESVIMKVSLSQVQGFPGEDKIMVVFHNITRLKKLETIRTDFVANVTHEIRTPLTAIIGYLETLQEGALQNTDDARRFIDIMLKQAQRLNRLVEDLMTLSKIELGDALLRFEDVSLHDIAGNIFALLEAKTTAKKIRMENRLSQDLLTIKADRDRINQVFVNVLDNAVKFTPETGQVTLDGAEKDGFVVVRISDTGMGIPRDEIQRLGERFYRVDKTRSRELGGTGLGLSIVKHLMLAHGGKMEIESQLGHGTTVSLFFPVKKI